MSLASVRAHLATFGRDGEVIVPEVSSATVELAAAALGVEPARIAKTIALRSDDPDACVLVVAAGDARIDNAAYKATFGRKAQMVRAEDVERVTGHPVGGVCPFANPPGTVVHLDESLRRFTTVFPACGTASSAIELTPDELASISGALGWVAVTR
ncbi:MAG: YbaK/EbsC family protein [Aeromicrobium sp.]|uniref:YbaK/EbsC family protein n=1 Tax=Aeromicrobium sp. TaxID=1871063 RepID=UPI0026109ED8|nr:YbaK/EbsC family protein [Aeromicrobium sp.]MDF1705542.1 YbaK/EbsC family protein [Aeromicrobium sp.]